LFSQRTKPPFWLGSSQLSMFDYRSIATGFHQPRSLPFLAPPRYSQRFHVPDRACGASRSENNALPNTTVPGKMRHMLTALIVRLESIISTPDLLFTTGLLLMWGVPFCYPRTSLCDIQQLLQTSRTHTPSRNC
jgi:hypothetical protein